MTINSGHSQFDLVGVQKYCTKLDSSCKQTDECLSIDNFAIHYLKPMANQTLLSIEECKSQQGSHSTEAEEVLARKEYLENKGFKPNSGFKWNTGEQTFDLQVNDALLSEKIGFTKLCQLSVVEAYQQRKKLAEFFTKYTMSDEARKKFWRVKIGNRLRISKALFESLVDRLNVEGIPKKAEKTIIDDLDRTFPICNDLHEGKEMYQNMKLVLSLFEVIYYNPALQAGYRVCSGHELPSADALLLFRHLRIISVPLEPGGGQPDDAGPVHIRHAQSYRLLQDLRQLPGAAIP